MSVFDSLRGSPKRSSKVAALGQNPTNHNTNPASIYTAAPDPLIQHLPFPDKFYIVAAFCEDPPVGGGVRAIDDDTVLLLHALHEQATKGPNTKPRPWSLWETDTQLRWDAWKALEQMPALEAMSLYCATVEEDNPGWWRLLTRNLSEKEKKDIVQTAAACAKEYRRFVDAGVLVGPSGDRQAAFLSAEPASTARESSDWSDAATALKGFGLGGLADTIDYLSTQRPVRPRSNGENSINHPKYLPTDQSDTISASAMRNRLKNTQNLPAQKSTDALADQLVTTSGALDAITQMFTWRVMETKGGPATKPEPRYHHVCWLVDGRSMWVAFGSKDGKKLTGEKVWVLDLQTTTWTTRVAVSENGKDDVAVMGAAALVAPNEAAYVFGGAGRRKNAGNKKAFGGFFGSDENGKRDDSDSDDETIAVRCLDLTTDPGLADGVRERVSGKHKHRGKKRGHMEWIDLSDASDTTAVVSCSVENEIANRLNETGLGDENGSQMDVDAVVVIDNEILQQGDSPSAPGVPGDGDVSGSITSSEHSQRTLAFPCARAHHSATLVGGEVYVFGGSRVGGSTGASDSGKVLGDLWAFDGAEGTWRECHGEREDADGAAGAGGKGTTVPSTRKTKPVADTKWRGVKAPCPRSGHVAGAVDDRFLVVFGGDGCDPGASGSGLADQHVHVFDTFAQAWVETKVGGKPPAPRSGHAACVLGNSLFITGGGDGTEARPETHKLDCASAKEGVYVWSVVNSGVGEGQKSAAGLEGASLVPFKSATGEFLVAFGGSDGTCVGDVRVMRVSYLGK